MNINNIILYCRIVKIVCYIKVIYILKLKHWLVTFSMIICFCFKKTLKNVWEMRLRDTAHPEYHTAQKMKFSIKDFFSKCDHIYCRKP